MKVEPKAVVSLSPAEQAGEWFARLRMDTCTEFERAAFRRWFNESADNATAYRRIEAVWNDSAALRDDPAIQAATREALRVRAPRPRGNRSAARRRWLVAAMAVLTLGGIVALMTTEPVVPAVWSTLAWSGERFVTATAEQRTIALTDGSEVLLDAESILRVRYDDQTRHVVLEKGQAQFKVAKDAMRPFVVKAADGAIRAIGTEFQVRLEGEAVVVTLLEGKISVDVPAVLGGLVAPAKSELLVAGQQVRYGNSRRAPIAKQAADIEVAQGWTHGDLVFKKWPLDELVTEMNRHTSTKIRIEDPALRELLVNGRFRAGDQQSLIVALQHQWQIQARRVGDDEIALSSTPLDAP
jgi:transmembrane sensor